MNVRQIEIFKAVMETGTVTGAAERLFVSQPAVSKQLKQLEKHLGFALFDRISGRLAPTFEARALYDQVERVYGGLYELARFAEDLKTSARGRLMVGALPLLSARWLPHVVAGFLSERQDVQVTLQARRSVRVAEWVAGRQIDIGIAFPCRQHADIEQEFLTTLEVVCILPPDSPLARKRVVTAEDLHEQPFIRLNGFDRMPSIMDRTLEEAGAVPVVRVETYTAAVACSMVAEGVGAALIDAVSASDNLHLGIVVRPFRPRIGLDVVLLRPSQSPRSQLVDAFVGTLREQVKATRPGRPRPEMFRRNG
jgi:DNA-binding transcriptional LysR family regulator